MKRFALPLAFMLAGCASLPPRTCSKDYAALRLRELVLIDAGERIDATIDESARTADQRAQVSLGEALANSRTRVADREDLAIIDRARALLSSTAAWDRHDDRTCPTGKKQLSLFCALKRASLDTLGVYEHRRTALQEVRFALEDATRGRQYEHRLQDFNNDPATHLNDVWAVLDTARKSVADRLTKQDRCLL